MSWFQKWRPVNFDDVIGQPVAVAMMKQNFAKPPESRNRVFLLQGESGCGKTTIPTVVAHMLNCNMDFDFANINAGSDRGIDAIRREVNLMGTSPVQGEGRVWLFDECHGLTREAQEALLKPMENPPDGVYLFFATTEMEKLKKTFRDRCMLINIQPLSAKSLAMICHRIAKLENLSISKDEYYELATAAHHSARKAIQILEMRSMCATMADAIKMALDKCVDMETSAERLCQLLMNYSATWEGDVAPFLNTFRGQAEGARLSVVGYLRSCLINSSYEGNRATVARMLAIFVAREYYTCGDAKLALDCYQAMCKK